MKKMALLISSLFVVVVTWMIVSDMGNERFAVALRKQLRNPKANSLWVRLQRERVLNDEPEFYTASVRSGQGTRIVIAFSGAFASWPGGEHKTLVLCNEKMGILDWLAIDDEDWLAKKPLVTGDLNKPLFCTLRRPGQLVQRIVNVDDDKLKLTYSPGTEPN